MGDITILLVEDERIEAIDIKHTLESFGYEVPYIASRGEEAVEKALEIRPDLILMDIILKGDSDGVEAASKIKNLNIPVIYLTAHSEESTIERAKQTEPYGYIIKPYDSKELKYTIELAIYKNQMEKELKESEKKFYLLFENSPLPYQSLDENGNFLMVNPAWCASLGYSQDEVIGKNFAEFLAPEYKEHFKKNFPRFKAAGEIHDVQFEMKRKDGSYIFVSYEGKIGYDELGNFKQTHCIFQNITERIKAEKARIESEKKYSYLFDKVPIGIGISDGSGHVLDANKAMQKITGYTLEEFKKIDLNDTIAFPEDREPFLKELHKNGKVWDYEVQLKRKNGNIYHALLNSELTEMGGQKVVLSTTRDITERKKGEKRREKGEKALRESEEQLKVLFDSFEDQIFIKDRKLLYMQVNPALEHFFGIKREDIIGKTDEELFGPEHVEHIKKIDARVLKGERIKEQTPPIGPSNTIFDVIKSPMYNVDGEIIGLCGIARDITKEQKAEKTLEKSEKSYRTIFENSGTAILTFKNDGTIILINSEWEKLSGYSRDEVEGKMNWMELVHPDYLEKMMDYHLQRVKDPDSVANKYQTSFITKSGDNLVMHVNVTPLPGTDKWLASAVDITDLKNTEKKLEKNVLRFRALAENAIDGIITTNSIGKILYFNNSLLEMFGYTQDELEGSQLTTLMPERYRENFTEGLRKFQATGEHRIAGKTIETIGLKKDGNEFPFEMSLTKWEIEKEIYFTSIIRDITERKKAENTLKESEAYYRTIFTHTGAANIIIGEDTTITLANPEFEKLSGYSADEIEGKLRWAIFIREDDLERMKEYHVQRRINPELAPEKYEFHFVNRQGDVKNIILFVALIPGTKKSIASLLDITEQKRVNENLRWELTVNEALNEIYAPLVSENSKIDEISSLILNQTLELTDSEYGYIGEIKPHTHNMMLLSIMPPRPLNEPQKPILKLEKDGINDGLMSHSLNIKKGFFTNDPTSHPSYREDDGHLKIKNFLSVPVMLKNELVGQISVANTNRDYSENDLDAVDRLSHFYSLALQKIRDREEIKTSLAEKVVLLREIHHRVKNNMQIISSLLNLQIQYEDLDETTGVLKESQGRVKSMAMVHEKLYQSDSFSKINFKDYITNLISDIFYSYGIERGSIGWELDVEDINIGIDTAIPLGLIINELVTNSVKYAFPQGEGTITINLKALPEQIKLTITDDGIGLPKNIDTKNTKTLGLQLVNNLVNQIDGNIEVDGSQGTEFNITFKELEYKERI